MLTNKVIDAISKIFTNTKNYSVDVNKVFEVHLAEPYSYGMQTLTPPTGSINTEPYVSVSIYHYSKFVGWLFVYPHKCNIEFFQSPHKEVKKHLYAIKNTLSYFGNYADLEIKTKEVKC